MKKTNANLIVMFVAGISLLTVCITFYLMGVSEESLRLTLRETARISTLLFVFIFIASPLHKLTKSNFSKWLIVNRRYLGIGFGVSHLIHLGLIVWLLYAYSNGELLSMVPLSSFIVGGIGYLLVFAMLATSNDQSIRVLGFKRWKRVHTFGMYYLLVAFLTSYIGLLEKDLALYAPLVLSLVLACLIRGFAYFNHSVKARTA